MRWYCNIDSEGLSGWDDGKVGSESITSLVSSFGFFQSRIDSRPITISDQTVEWSLVQPTAAQYEFDASMTVVVVEECSARTKFIVNRDHKHHHITTNGDERVAPDIHVVVVCYINPGGATVNRGSLRWIKPVKIKRTVWLLVLLLVGIHHDQYHSSIDGTRGTLVAVPAVLVTMVVSAWCPTMNRLLGHERKSSLTDTCQSPFPMTILYQKRTKDQKTSRQTTSGSYRIQDRVRGATNTNATITTTPSATSPHERYEQNLILDLQRCTTVEHVWNLIGSSSMPWCSDPPDVVTDHSTTTIIQISSRMLIRLSKLYMQMHNQQMERQPQPISNTTNHQHHHTEWNRSRSLLRQVVYHWIGESTRWAVTLPSNHVVSSSTPSSSSVSHNNMVDAIVDGTKAGAVLARLLPLLFLDCDNDDDDDRTYSILTKPLVEFYTKYGSLLIPYMQPHHISGLKWALDCLLVLTKSTGSTDESMNDDTLQIPPSIQDAYTALNLPFYIIPRCLSMMDCDGRPITVDQMVRQVDFRTDEIRTNGASVTERRLTAWQGDDHVTPFAYSGKAMERDDWSPMVRHVRNQLWNLTGQYYDGCLLNLYHNGKSGMRYHSDPDQGMLWDYDTAVVSIGASRRFTFRSISTTAAGLQPQPHSFIVMDSDVTYMFNNCQQLYQHCVKNAENKNETTSRISLVFKRTYQYYENMLHHRGKC